MIANILITLLVFGTLGFIVRMLITHDKRMKEIERKRKVLSVLEKMNQDLRSEFDSALAEKLSSKERAKKLEALKQKGWQEII